MSRRSTVVLILAVVLIFAFAATAFAQTPTAAGRRIMTANLQNILRPPAARELAKFGIAISLTADQKTAIKALYKTWAAAMKQILPDRGAGVQGVLNGLQQPSPNKSDLGAAAAKVEQADAAILNAEFDFWIGLKGILSQQQQAAVSSYVMQRAQREFGAPAKPIAPPPAPRAH